ncbi:hypothetical protein [Gallibacterium salpingitidis]|uniref:Uncharacterized protein n=1 Tax=Gallibacterium salpingitidis TaxID=505341 RepID=A0A1A7NVF2_9PAST|nr:hypothetical protein [Gallibacterium salpingitidis]OBW92984.1 hypothetical protein QS62_07910 [Gallibacterium salpingitidis]
MQHLPFQSSFRQTYSLLTKTEGYYLKGKWVDGEEVEQELIASIQPVSLKEMDRLVVMMQGRHIVSAIKIYTEQQLDVAGENNHNGTIVLFEGSRYEVIARSSYHSSVIEHYRYFAQKVK